MTAWSKEGPRWRVDARDAVTGEGTTFHGDAVIVTVPVSVLTNGRIAFDPPLPSRVTGALARVGAGVVTKAFFAFAEPFWSPLWSFSTIGSHRFDLELWVDVSTTVGRPTLCAFATGERAARIETQGRDALLTLGHEILTRRARRRVTISLSRSGGAISDRRDDRTARGRAGPRGAGAC